MRKKLTLDDTLAVRTLPHVVAADAGQPYTKAFRVGDVSVKYEGRKVAGAILEGHTAQVADVTNSTLHEGRFFTDGEDQSHGKVCVIAHDTAEELFSGGGSDRERSQRGDGALYRDWRAGQALGNRRRLGRQRYLQRQYNESASHGVLYSDQFHGVERRGDSVVDRNSWFSRSARLWLHRYTDGKTDHQCRKVGGRGLFLQVRWVCVGHRTKNDSKLHRVLMPRLDEAVASVRRSKRCRLCQPLVFHERRRSAGSVGVSDIVVSP